MKTPAQQRQHSRFGFRTSQKGYILLITILFVGAIASAILSSVLLLGTSSNQVSLSVLEANQALAQAQGCAEYALRALRDSPYYAGGEIVTLGAGTCEVLPVGGIGNSNRLICTEGKVQDTVRRLEVIVSQLLPATTIYSWQEVPVFTLCE